MEFYDYIFCGGTLKNIHRALKYKDKKILIITKNTYLGDEICSGLNYNLPINKDSIYFQNVLDTNGYIHPDKFKRKLEDICLENNIKFYYCAFAGEVKDNTVEVISKGGIKKFKFVNYIDEENISGNEFSAFIEKDNEYKIFTVKAKDKNEGILKILENYPKDCTLGRMAYSTSRKIDIKEEIEIPIKENKVKTINNKKYDFVIVGGGTAGAMCAIYLGRQGFKTLIIEMNEVLGGTGTVGGVSTYWFGKNYSDVQEIDNLVNKICEKYSISQEYRIWGKDDFHPDIKAYVIELLCREANVDIEFKSMFARINEKEKVIEYINNSINYVNYKWVIDATGDADVVKAMGGDYTYGLENITYWSSLAQYTTTRKYKNNFSSSVYLDDFDDYTDFIYTGRRRGDTFDHGTYVALRESRHIKGIYTIQLEDIISFKTYDDGFYTCYSNYDPKGKLDNKMIYFGFLPSQNSIQIPLSACIPTKNEKELENIVVIGKAISSTHDAFPPIRMQKDLMHQGAAMAYILGEAVDKNSLLNINLENAKEKIRETGDLIYLNYENYSEKYKSHWVDQPFEEEVKVLPYIHYMIINGKQNIEEIREDFDNSKNDEEKLFYGKLLLYHDDYYGEDFIYDYIVNKISVDLPKRFGSTTCVTLLPDHGVMPEVVYAINALAHGKKRNFDFLNIIYDHLKADRDYISNEKGVYHYIECFAYVLEHSQSIVAKNSLLKILEFPEFDNAKKYENRFSVMSQRLLILLTIIYKSLAVNNIQVGIDGLKELSNIYDKTIASTAKSTLENITK